EDIVPEEKAAKPPPLPPKLPPRPSNAAKPSAAPAAIPPPRNKAGGDPFNEPPEPRPPKGSPDEKLDFFRQVVKIKNDTLGRARQLYQEREQEAEQLRVAANQLTTELDSAQSQLKEARD